MRAGDESFERLQAALEEIAAGDVAELLAEARAQARARIRTMLTDALAQTMLEHAREQLEQAQTGPARAHPGVEERRAPTPPATVPRASSANGHHRDPEEHALGWYVYGVTAAGGPAIPADLPGIDSAEPVSTLHDGALEALVSRVPLADFDDDRLRERLADADWLERTARRHEEVLDAVRALRTVIPMRLCSIYRDDDGVRAMLGRQAEALRDALTRLAGKAEWGLKVFHDPQVEPPDTTTNGSPPAPLDADAGAAYLEIRRRAHHERRHSARRLEDACRSIHERLTGLAAQGLIVPPQRPEVTGHAGEMILNAVYLVDEADQADFHAEVSALGAEFQPLGLELEPTGPWPAYNFVPDTIGAAR